MNSSESIIKLASALTKFNGEVSKISKDAKNPFFKNNYATLDNIVDEIRPVLTKNGLSILQIPGGDGENVIMKTLLIHESGEWLESDPLVMKPVKNDPQAVGSCITYARRYSLGSFLSLNTGEDDDGNAAAGKSKQETAKQTITLDQETEIQDLIKETKSKLPDIYKFYKITKLSDMTPDNYTHCKNYLQKKIS